MATKNEVKKLVSPTLHPMNISGIPGFEDHKGYVAHAVTALDAAYQSVEHVIEASAKLARDETRSPKYRVLMAAQLADKYLANLQKDFNQSHSRLSAGIQHTETELTKPLEEYAGIGNVATEIRAHLKSMSSGERVKFISEALERGDEKTLKSCLGAPAYLSGMSQAEADHATRNYHAKCNPELAQRLDVMKKAREKLELAERVMVQAMEKAVGASHFEIEKLRAASNAAEEALILKNFTQVEN